MPNHVHFVVVAKHVDSLAMLFCQVHRHYSRQINFRKNWRGHLWQAHLSGSDDQRVTVQPMLERMSDWGAYLSTEEASLKLSAIRQYTQTGRPLGEEGFTDALETLTGKAIKKRKPGPKLGNK